MYTHTHIYIHIYVYTEEVKDEKTETEGTGVPGVKPKGKGKLGVGRPGKHNYDGWEAFLTVEEEADDVKAMARAKSRMRKDAAKSAFKGKKGTRWLWHVYVQRETSNHLVNI